MNPTNTTLLLACLCATAHAQIATLTLPAGIGDDPRSVQLVGNNHLAISNQVDGWQHMVDVSNPLNPTLTTSYNPPYGDQWFEAEFTPDFGGRLFTAHRGGGINMIDVSVPATPFAVNSVPTVYHFRGLRYLSTPIANPVLYYNATNQGLEAYSVLGGGTSLSAVWNNFGPSQDGNGLEFLQLPGTVIGHLYQLGAPPANPTTRELRVFDLTNPIAPVQCSLQTLTGQQNGNGHAQLRKSGIPFAPRIVASRWNDGLDLIDATTPCSPTITNMFPSSFAGLTITYWGSRPFPNTPFVLVYGSLIVNSNPNVRFYFWWPWTVPASGPAIPGTPTIVPLDTHDVIYDVNTTRIYMVGRLGTQGVLWVF